MPSQQTSRVKSINTFEGEIDEAFPPMAVMITLDDEIDLSRGDMIVHPNNLPRIEAALRAADVRADVAALEGLNHLLQRADTGMVSEYAGIEETMDPEALRRIGDWVVATVGKS